MKRSEAILADLRAGNMSDAQVARRHGVTRGRVWQIRHAAGIPPSTRPPKPPVVRSPVFWTDDEIAYLIEHADAPMTTVAAALGRSIGAIRGMRERLVKQGRLPRQKEPYTEDELALLADQTLTTAEVAERTGRSRQVIAQSRWTRGIRGLQREPKRPWTPEEIERLVALHDRPTREVAALLGRTVRAIQNQRYALLREGRTPPRRRRSGATSSC
jgi:hypothetical protein